MITLFDTAEAQREGEEKRSAATQADQDETQPRVTSSEVPVNAVEQPIGALIHSPFDPNPRTLDKAQNGFIMCRVCDSVQPAAGHECDRISTNDEHAREGDLCRLCGMLILEDGNGLVCSGCASDRMRLAATRVVLRRAEHAESLLCAMAWDEGSGAIEVRHGEGTDPSNCLFCNLSHHQEAAR